MKGTILEARNLVTKSGDLTTVIGPGGCPIGR
jgi:hypothetical protein